MTQPGSASPTADADLDPMILACADEEWRKVAMLIARITNAARAAALEIDSQAIASRIYALAEANLLEVKGNVRRWRSAEIRRAPTA